MVVETEVRALVDRKLDENFQDFWYKILNFNVLRLNKICVELGSPKEAAICQVIAWHHYLNSISDSFTPSLDEIKNLVINDVILENQNNSAKEYLKQLRNKYQIEILADLNEISE